MLSRRQFAVTRHGIFGPKIAARLRSTMARGRYGPKGLENDYSDRVSAPASLFRRPAPQLPEPCQLPISLSQLTFPARPNS